MADKINKNKTGLAVGLLLGLLHLVWALMVAVGVAKPLSDWILGLHFLNIAYTIAAFNALTALLLVVITFVCGYVMGYVLAWLWNWVHKK